MKEDAIWNELKDDWAGRRYETFQAKTLILIVEDRNDYIKYRFDISDPNLFRFHEASKDDFKKDIDDGRLIRVR